MSAIEMVMPFAIIAKLMIAFGLFGIIAVISHVVSKKKGRQ